MIIVKHVATCSCCSVNDSDLNKQKHHLLKNNAYEVDNYYFVSAFDI